MPSLNNIPWSAHYAGDSAIIIEFAQHIERRIVAQVNRLDAIIHVAADKGKLHGIKETVPTFRSLAILFDNNQIHPDDILEFLGNLTVSDSSEDAKDPQATRHWELPILYGTSHGPDLDSVAQATGLSCDAVVDLHVNSKLSVYMLGFLPGYAFLGDTPKALHLPRRREPRLRVPAGSVAIAMQLTGIYPWESPGGWHILGNCPVPMFDAQMSPPALLKAGDSISFTQIDETQFQTLKHEYSESRVDRSRWLKGGT